ncbi:MAG: putative ABC transport system ATP-binding protein [Parasphingorhabdus sp.]
MEYPDQGRVVINGEELRPGQESRNTIIRRRQIGIVFQFFNLVPTLTVLENLQLPLLLNSIHNDHQQAAQMLDRFGMSGFSSALPVHLSGGEQQRVSVARALIHQPSVVLADEPTGSLDQNSGLQVLEMLREAANQGCTVCMVTHSKLAANKSDYCLQLKDGKLSQV